MFGLFKRRAAPLPEIPKFREEPVRPIEPLRSTPKRDESVIVEEHEAADAEAIEELRRAQTETGMHRAWRRITG
jgi:hypothetical protein